MTFTNSKIAQIYGYSVCLVCVIIFFISIAGILGAAVDLTNPIRADGRGSFSTSGPPLPLTSFTAYRAAARRQDANTPAIRPISDDELRQNYDAEREDRIGAVRFRALRAFVVGIVFIILTAGLFLLHWRWLRRSETVAVAP